MPPSHGAEFPGLGVSIERAAAAGTGSVAAEQVRHYGNVRIASMVQAGKPQCCLDGLQQREVGVKGIAFHAIFALAVDLHGEDDVVLVLRRKHTVGVVEQSTVVVFIPNDDNRVSPFVPDWRRFDALDQPLDGDVALLNQTRIQARGGSHRRTAWWETRVKSAEGVTVPAAVLIVALIRLTMKENDGTFPVARSA